MTLDEKRRLIASRTDWFHSIDVGGLTTPGMCPAEYLQFEVDTMQLPHDLTGQRVLDIGTFDGYFAFECERRGAEVVAIDVNPEDCRCFSLAKRMRGSGVRFFEMSIYDLDVDRLGGPFDLVLCLGVLYHLRHLFVALDQLWRATTRQLIVETHVIDDHFIFADGSIGHLAGIDRRLVETPIFRFYRFNELGNDYSNWFGGNIVAVKELLASAGFVPEVLGAWGGRAMLRATKNTTTPREWEVGSYEGTRFERQSDGTWRSLWIDPWKHGLPDRR